VRNINYNWTAKLEYNGLNHCWKICSYLIFDCPNEIVSEKKKKKKKKNQKKKKKKKIINRRGKKKK